MSERITGEESQNQEVVFQRARWGYVEGYAHSVEPDRYNFIYVLPSNAESRSVKVNEYGQGSDRHYRVEFGYDDLDATEVVEIPLHTGGRSLTSLTISGFYGVEDYCEKFGFKISDEGTVDLNIPEEINY